MQPFPAGFRSALLIAGVLGGMLMPHSATAATGSSELRIADVDVSDSGVVTATVVAPEADFAVDGGDAIELRVGGRARDVDTASLEPDDAAVAVVADTSADQPPERFRLTTNFLTELALRLSDESPMAVVAAGAPPRVIQQPTTDMVQRMAAVDDLTMGGDRALLDGVALAIDQLSALRQRHRRVVVVAAGPDQVSRTDVAQVAQQLADAEAALYVASPGPGSAAAEELAELAVRTGGLVLAGDDAGDPFQTASALVADLTSQLRVSFQLGEAADQPATLRLTTADGVTAETIIDLPPAPTPASGQADAEPGEVAQAPEVGVEPAMESGPSTPTQPGSSAEAAAVLVAIALIAASLFIALRPSRTSTPVNSTAQGSAASATMPQRRRRQGTGEEGPGRASPARATGISSELHGRVQEPSRLAVPVGSPAGRVPRRTNSTPAPATKWQRTAARVQRWVGGEPQSLQRAAARIEADRQAIRASSHATARRWRLIAAVLTSLPVMFGTMRQVMDPGFIGRVLVSRTESVGLILALVLTAVGGVWLWLVTQPPFTALPWRRHVNRERLRRCESLADTADRALLQLVARDEIDATSTGDVLESRHQPLDLEEVLTTLSRDGVTQEEVAHIRAVVYAEWKQALRESAQALPVSVMTAFTASIVPAILLVGVLAQ